MPATKYESGSDQSHAGAPARPCPICGKPGTFATRPFCSKRCANIDPHRWLGSVYSVPASHEPGIGGSGSSEDHGANIPKPKS